MKFQLHIFILCTLLIGALSLPCLLFPPKANAADITPKTTIYQGIDVSRWQGTIDFAAVKNAGIEVVYIRSSYGNHTIDPYFETNYQKAKDAGLKIGFYHYVTATSISEAQEQAEFFADLASEKNYEGRLAMDFETFSDLSDTEINQIANAFLTTLEKRTGHTPVFYTDSSNAKTLWQSSFARYPLWLAEYGVESPSQNPVWSQWAGWQYEDQGQVSGISGNVDKDYFKPTMLIDDTSSNPNPEPEPNPTPPEDNQESTQQITVQPGDTLWDIAQKYHTTVNQIVALNHIANPNLIHPGQIIKLPENQNTTNPRTYQVKSGDTLWDIAQKYHTTVNQIVDLNHISNPNLIYPGQTIQIP